MIFHSVLIKVLIIVEWSHFLKYLLSESLTKTLIKIDEFNNIVEIDEFKMHQHKYHKGYHGDFF